MAHHPKFEGFRFIGDKRTQLAHVGRHFRLADALDDHAPILVPMRGGGAPEPRVTLSARVLAAAVSTHIVITGAEKRAALEKAQSLPVEEAPVRAVLSGATVHWAP